MYAPERLVEIEASAEGRRLRPAVRRAAHAFVLVIACVLGGAATPGAAKGPSLRELLSRYARAASEPGAAEIEHAETSGSLVGARLTGSFHAWQQGDDERVDQNLGPRVERSLRLGESLFAQDANGNVRRLTGVLAKRDRTRRFIDSGAFANEPERCVLRGMAPVDGRDTYALDVAADRGETETLYLDARTSLPARVAYDDDDGRSTIDFSDWRTIEGHRFAFRSVESDGNHRFDTTQITASVSLDVPIDLAVFTPFAQRPIEMTGSEVVPLAWYGGHLYAPVRISGRAYTFLVDTGAQDILIDRHVASDLHLTPLGAFEASGASRTAGLQLVRLGELDIGSGRLHDLVVSTIDLGASTAGAFHIDGILGYPFFATTAVRIDVANRTMTFGPPGSLAVTGQRLDIDLDRSFPEAHMNLGGNTPASLLVDTGDAAELLLYKPFVDMHPGIVPFSSTERMSFGIGGETRSYRSLLDELDVAGIKLFHVETDVMLATGGAFADRFDAGNLGLGVLRNFIVTFDYAGGAMYLERSATFDDGSLRA